MFDITLPLPPYKRDPLLTDDENYLVWVAILCRNSVSRRGHMGAMFVLNKPDNLTESVEFLPNNNNLNSSEQGSESLEAEQQKVFASRVLVHANNTPVMLPFGSKVIEKKTKEVHAEAMCIIRAAKGLYTNEKAATQNLANTTCYVTAAPCTECFMILVAAGVKSVVHLGRQVAPALRVAAHVAGMQLVHTDQERMRTLDIQTRVKLFWEQQGETAIATRSRVDTWWTDAIVRHQAAALELGVSDDPSNNELVMTADDQNNEIEQTKKRKIVA